jgi:hypothetical protein
MGLLMVVGGASFIFCNQACARAFRCANFFILHYHPLSDFICLCLVRWFDLVSCIFLLTRIKWLFIHYPDPWLKTRSGFDLRRDLDFESVAPNQFSRYFFLKIKISIKVIVQFHLINFVLKIVNGLRVGFWPS